MWIEIPSGGVQSKQTFSPEVGTNLTKEGPFLCPVNLQCDLNVLRHVPAIVCHVQRYECPLLVVFWKVSRALC